ncbi:COP1-interacting protein 7 [Sesamum alatum]|uniref:COP1-interacting protein 7 n=1 Tax=Sesamum alatum TaxID=300844 RepID=A0AAE1YCQ4_9LAMI|nr:COP1-interacting protein 7 [Sesamum alatum]
MKASTRLSSAVFQLTPTRTRCDLFIIANGKKEKIASGLLNPFLAHLKAAQDQIAKGGYSILLEPETDVDAAWFTKATMERFVRFVSTPEILERVYTIETEILQIQEAIAMQSNNDMGQSIVEDHQEKLRGGCEANKSVPDANEEKAIVLYKPGAPLPEPNGSCSEEENSKVQLLKVLETRKRMLQKEQGMAFARAAAAGFDIDHVALLVSFAECFGALRLFEACSRFMDLWKCKHETGEWLDIEASEALSTLSDFSATNASGIILSATHNQHDSSNHEAGSLDNGKSDSTYNAYNPAPNGQQEYFQGQFPQIVFPPWPMHALPGAQPGFQAIPVQGIPYYQTYAGNGPFFQSPHHPVEHSLSNIGQSGLKMQSLDGGDSNAGSEMWELDKTKSLDDTDAEVSRSRKPRKKAGRSDKKQSGMVVIRNINYITSKEKKSGSETNSNSDSDIDTEDENSETDDHGMIHQNNKRYSKIKGDQLKSQDKLNFSNDEVSNSRKDTDDGYWQAFQSCLLRGSDEDVRGGNESMFAMEKDVIIKRRSNTVIVDPLELGARETGEIQDTRMSDITRFSGSTSCRPRGSGDDAIFSSVDNDFRGSNDQTHIQFDETNGSKIVSRPVHEDFIVGSQQTQAIFRNSSDPLALNGFEGVIGKMDREPTHGMSDETFIVPFRSMSIDQDGQADRTAIDVDSEIPISNKKLDSEGNRNRVYYEPDDFSLMPEREIEKGFVGYDPALDYEMQVCVESQEQEGKDVSEVKGGLKKSDKDRRSKVTSDSVHRQRTGGPSMKGKPLKMSPSEDARVRAEKLRSYKADLQRMKKEKEEAEMKRLEALKLERQKRIAARGSFSSRKSSVLSPQTKQFPAKLSPATNRGSKFSDSDPGSSSPLQRSKIRTSLGSTELLKTSKSSKLIEISHMRGNRLTRSSSSLSESKRESNGGTPDSKAPMARIRRLSEPKPVASPVTSVKDRSAEAVSRRKLSEGPDKNKISAIINLDKSKAATLPELKIKTSTTHINAGENISSVEDQKVNGIKPSSFCENAELNGSNCITAHQTDADENTVIEKTVVMLEYEKPSIPPLHSSEGKSEVTNRRYDDGDTGAKSDVISELAPIHGPASPMDGVDGDPKICQLQNQLGNSNEVRTVYQEQVPPNCANIAVAEKPDRDVSAHDSSVEDPCTGQASCGKSPQVSSGVVARVETVKAHIPDIKTLKLDKNPVLEKTLSKEPSKGLRRLLKFGKKNHTSSYVDQSFDSECTSVDGTEHDDSARNTASTSEVGTLRNLIWQDETPTAGNASQKISRHFSLLSPFRSKTNQKKQAS